MSNVNQIAFPAVIDHSESKVRCAYGCATDAIQKFGQVNDQTTPAELRAIWAGLTNAAEFLNGIAFEEYRK